MSDDEQKTVCWREVVAAARARGHFTIAEKRLASHAWTTCAIGEQHALHPELGVLHIPRGWDSVTPATPTLRYLGSEGCAEDEDGFVTAVSENNFDMADRVLDKLDDLILTFKRQGGAVNKRQRKKTG